MSTIATYWYSPGAPGLTHNSAPVPTSRPFASNHRRLAIRSLGLTLAVRQAVSPTHSFSGSGATETITLSGTSFT